MLFFRSGFEVWSENSMFGQEDKMSTEHKILKEKHETLVRNSQSLEERIKQVEETYETMKKDLERRTKELEVANKRLQEDCARERREKEKYKTVEKERKARIDELMKKNQELLIAKRNVEEELKKLENKYVESTENFGLVEEKCAYLKSIYDASGTPSSVMSGIGETDDLIGHEENKENHNVNNNIVTDAIVISDESDAEYDNPPRESSHRSLDRNQEEEQGRNGTTSSALGEISTPRSANHPPRFSASSPSSPSSSSSSDGYDVTVQFPADWPEWATPKTPANKP